MMALRVAILLCLATAWSASLHQMRSGIVHSQQYLTTAEANFALSNVLPHETSTAAFSTSAHDLENLHESIIASSVKTISCEERATPYATALKTNGSITLTCPANCVTGVTETSAGWPVYGAGPFRVDSDVCRAGYFAGVLGHSGGPVTLEYAGEETEDVPFGSVDHLRFCFRGMRNGTICADGRRRRKPAPAPKNYCPEGHATFLPTVTPSRTPTLRPTRMPTFHPSPVPSETPTEPPSHSPTPVPTEAPTTLAPSPSPSHTPTAEPTPLPTRPPTEMPSHPPTRRPTVAPTKAPCFSKQERCPAGWKHMKARGLAKCSALATNWRYKYMGKQVEMSLPGIKYGAKATQSDCFNKCGETSACKQAVHVHGHCYPMNTASAEDQDGKGGSNTGFTSIHCNGGPSKKQCSKLAYKYTYPWGNPPGCCGGYYDDPTNTILNDGNIPSSLSRSNCVEWNTGSHDYDPVLDLGGNFHVDYVDVSYVVFKGYGKSAPKSITIHSSKANTSLKTPSSSVHKTVLNSGFNENNGGHTVRIHTNGWGAVRYLLLSEVVPKAKGHHGLISEVTVCGKREAQKKRSLGPGTCEKQLSSAACTAAGGKLEGTLLPNGGFEKGTKSSIPSGWKRYHTYGTTGLISADVAHSGQFSIKYSGSGWQLIENGPSEADSLKVKKGILYTFTFWARSTSARQYIRSEFLRYGSYSASAHYIGRPSVSTGSFYKFHITSKANVWQKFSQSIIFSRDDNNLRMNLGPLLQGKYGTSSAVYIDDVQFSGFKSSAVGCYKAYSGGSSIYNDQWSSMKKPWWGRSYSIQSCFQKCVSLNYDHFGLEDTTACFCGMGTPKIPTGTRCSSGVGRGHHVFVYKISGASSATCVKPAAVPVTRAPASKGPDCPTNPPTHYPTEAPTPIPPTRSPTAAPSLPRRGALCWSTGDPHYHSFDGRRFDFYAGGEYWLMKGNGVKISTNMERMRWVSYNTAIAIDVGGHTLKLSSSASGLTNRFSINGKKHSSAVRLSGVGMSLNNGKLELDFKNKGILVRVFTWAAQSHCWSHSCRKGLNVYIALKGGSSWKYRSLSGLCGNLDGNAGNDSPPALRSWPSIQVSSKDAMLESAQVSMLSEGDMTDSDSDFELMESAGDHCTANSTFNKTARKACAAVPAMADECFKDACVTGAIEEMARGYTAADKEATKLKRLVAAEETLTPTEVPTTRSPSTSPSNVPTEFPTLIPTNVPTATPIFLSTAAPCIPRNPP